MEQIRIIRNKSELEGTCYIELSLGKYQGKHWEETSLFFDEEVFGYIEAIFERNIPNYDHYSMNDADIEAWGKIISELKELNKLLDDSTEFDAILGKVGFVFSDTRDYFQNHFQQCRSQLCELIFEVVSWAEENIEKHGYISVLGI